MATEKGHLPCDREVAKGRRAHQDQKEHGNDKFEGQADSKTEKVFRE
jgi:hypothetical protein